MLLPLGLLLPLLFLRTGRGAEVLAASRRGWGAQGAVAEGPGPGESRGQAGQPGARCRPGCAGAGPGEARSPCGAGARRPCRLLSRLTALLLPAPAHNVHLCEGYAGPDGRPHAGFYCPRLTDPAGHVYCCQPGGSRALKSCCPRTERGALRGNGSAAAPPPSELRTSVLPLLGVGLYGCLVLALMAVDFLHFYRLHRGSSASAAAGEARTEDQAPGSVARAAARLLEQSARRSAAPPPRVTCPEAGAGPAPRASRALPESGGRARMTSVRRAMEEEPRMMPPPPPSPPAQASELRQEGNGLFQAGRYEEALAVYTRALSLCPPEARPGPHRALLHRNRAACHLKLEDYAQAELDASKAIEADGRDVKSLFRRSQALQKLGRLDEAVLDLQRCLSLEPKNKAFQEALRNLGSSMHEKMQAVSCTDSKVEQMFKMLLDPEEKDLDKKQKAAQNLIVLAREEPGAEKIFQSDGVCLLLQLLDTGRPDMALAALRTLTGLCHGHRSRTTVILAELGHQRLFAVLEMEDEQISLAAYNLLQVMFDALKEGLQRDVPDKEEALVLDTSRELKWLLKQLLEALARDSISSYGRDSILNLLISVVPRKSPQVPSNRLALWVIDQGLKEILEVGGTVSHGAGGLRVTENTHMTTAVLLSKLYGDLKCDGERENFHRLCEDYVRGWFQDHGVPGKLRAIQTASCLLQGPAEAGNRVLELSGIMESILALCASSREADQLVAVEALIHAADKAKRATFITANGVTLLKEIYKHSERDSIRIRALVGLCKLGSAGGTDFSMKQFAEGSTLKLAKQCRKWLCNETIDVGTRHWAAEGLAFLTLDADVKEELMEDKAALQALFQLAKSENRNSLFAVASTLVNCTSSYDHEELDPQMVELAKYAKQHIPEKHPKDKPAFVRRRVQKLLAAGVVSALTCMVKSESPSLSPACRELISRVFLAVVEDPEDRGAVVAAGGGKALIPLALEGTEAGQTKAAQALAKIAITTAPEMAFPGERIFEVVRPLVGLLHLNHTGLQNFEGLMALTNLAGTSERLRQKIVKEKAVPMIEGYMFEEHEMIRLAATECMCNLALSREVGELFLAEGSDRLKLLVLYSGEEDERLRQAASGTLAVLTSLLPPICPRIPQVTADWLEILQALLLSPSTELQHRGVVVVRNMVAADKEVAAKLMESETLEILSVMARLNDKPQVAQMAKECLAQAMAYSLIKANPAGGE
ncbi:protein unc-45 homolog A [Elgaria multicarinata webbii]|uniref:protein unc-45 homolog A n=1 Tax=Elgaria multicarinata webbii TaxID=159646 RepID=UPI002FCD58A7